MRLINRLSALRADDRGVAAMETAFVGTLLVAALMNVVEVSRYAYVAAQVAAATQAGAQSAIVACDTGETPITSNCPEAEDAVVAAIHGSSLGDAVNLKGAMTEAYYCISGDDKLLQVGGPSGSPPDCGAGEPKASLYLKVETTYAYQPIFPGLTIAETFSDTIDRTAWMRTL